VHLVVGLATKGDSAATPLDSALAVYKRDFQPSEQQNEPFAMAGLNVVAADTKSDAEDQFAVVRRMRAKAILGRGQGWTDDEADLALASPAGRTIDEMTKYTAVGTRDEVHAYLDDFARKTAVDELIVVFPSPTIEQRLRSVELTAR